MDKTRVLYLSYDGMTDSLGKSQVLPYLIGLSAKGFDITLISFEKENRFEKYKTQIEDITKVANINWIPLSYTSKPPVLSTLWDVYRLKNIIKKLYKQNKFDIVHCRSYITAMAGLWMKQKWGTRFLFDMRGFWADERIDGNIWSLKNPVFKTVYKYFKKKELAYFSNADHIVSLTECAKNEIKSWEKLKDYNLNITVIPCCADFNLFSKKNIKQNQLVEIKKNLNIPENTFIVSYLGSLGTWYQTKEMLEFFQLLLKYKPESHFLIITHDNPDIIWNDVTKLGIEKNKITITSADRSEVPNLIALSDYSIFFIKQAYSKKASSPTKQGEIMGLGIPIICNSGVGDVDTIVNDSKSGFIIHHFTENEYQQVIDKIMMNQTFNETDIINGAYKYYSLENGIERYFEIYKKLLKIISK